MSNAKHVERSIADVATQLRQLCLADGRDVGDLQRNVALFLSTHQRVQHSSFAIPARACTIDQSRAGERPYLAALGYLYGAGVLAAPVPAGVGDGFSRVLARSPRTAEKSGFADDPLHAVGLLLLAEAAGDGSAAQRLRELLSEAEGLSPLASLLVAVAHATNEHKVLLDDSRPADMALCVLAGHELAKRVFPGTDRSQAVEKLAEHACMGRVVPSADISSMLILAALEASVAHDVLFPPESPETGHGVDVAIVVALKEEFRELFNVIGDRCHHIEEGDRHYYRFDTPGPPGARPYRCIATFAGEMGPTTAGVVTERTLERWRPTTVVNLGIAAGIHDDVRVGDVIVGSQVDNYLDSAKAIGQGRFQRSGNGYQTDHLLLDRVRNFEFTHATLARKWRDEAGERLRGLEVNVRVLVNDGLLRDRPEQSEAHIASGPVVAADADFVSWVREGDRAYKALEMESGGVVTATHMSAHGTKALVLRAVSDFGDDRKARLDAVGRGALRRYAMRNTIEFLWALLHGGVFERQEGG